MIFTNWDWSTIASMPPLAPWDNNRLNFAMATEWTLGYGISWFCFNGVLGRVAKSQRIAAYPQISAMGWMGCWFMVVALISGLVVGSFDPTEWMIPIGGLAFGALALLFIAIANITTCVLIFYGAGVYMRETIKRLRWPLLMGACAISMIAWAFPGGPDLVYEREFVILGYNGATFAPGAAILIVDYYIFRKQKLDVIQLFERSPKGRYYYWRGFNFLTVLNLAIGAAFYLWLYNPVSLVTHGFFEYTTAFIPTFALCFVLQLIFTQIVKKAGKGGYDLKEDKGLPAIIEKVNL